MPSLEDRGEVIREGKILFFLSADIDRYPWVSLSSYDIFQIGKNFFLGLITVDCEEFLAIAVIVN